MADSVEQSVCIVAGQCLTKVFSSGEAEQSHGLCRSPTLWPDWVDREWS